MIDLLTGLVRDGRIAEIAVLLILAEALALSVLAVRAGRGRPAVAAILAHLAAGACLLMALRAALTAADPIAIAGWLAVALVAHGADLYLRLRRDGS